MVRRRDRVLPELGLRDPGTEQVGADGAHVAVQQLVPGLGERQRELVWVLQETSPDFLVNRVEAERQVRGQHGRAVLLLRVVRVRDDPRGVLGHPLVRARRALGELPLVLEQNLQKAVAPLRRPIGPGDFEPGGDRVARLAAAVGADPPETLLLQVCGLRLGADMGVGVTGAVGLAERVAAGDQREVSSSFIAIRWKVSRMNAAASFGSGFPIGPSGLT